MAAKKLDELLLAEGLVDEQSLSLARTEAIARQRKLAEIVIDLGLIDQRSLAKLLARAAGVDLVSPIDPRNALALASMIPPVVARRHQVVPVRHDSDALVVAMIDPFEPGVVELIESGSAMPVRRAVGVRSEIEMAVLELYHVEEDADRTIQLSPGLSLDLDGGLASGERDGLGDPAAWRASTGDVGEPAGEQLPDADRTAPSTARGLSETERLAHLERQIVSVTRMLAIIQSRLDTIDARLAHLAGTARTTH